jgi:hypothetical protein
VLCDESLGVGRGKFDGVWLVLFDGGSPLGGLGDASWGVLPLCCGVANV